MSGYTFTPTGWYATFDQSRSSGRIFQARVEAWSRDGVALVVDPAAGRLVPVSSMPGFVELRPCHRIAGVIEAPKGWRMHRVDSAGAFTAPVVGFAVDDEGAALPVVAGALQADASQLSHPNDTLLGPDDPDPEEAVAPATSA
ncbi:hypothetical protein [Gandjariella thermophila]|uniref:Uncharacterized protein n=1 Tax=Gandjariella thermophila TaxID=1931992 RepID=A0A4D4JEY7_9PSEU|nr:hypothetical protein [Gandjariella thermophila]GDY32879.1 hypothetical protein GTS_45120 [Gandjariella thermophila]